MALKDKLKDLISKRKVTVALEKDAIDKMEKVQRMAKIVSQETQNAKAQSSPNRE